MVTVPEGLVSAIIYPCKGLSYISNERQGTKCPVYMWLLKKACLLILVVFLLSGIDTLFPFNVTTESKEQ